MQNLEHSLKLGMTCPIYLFHGDEKLLMEQMINKIAVLVAPDGDSWNKEVYYGDDVSPDDIVDIAQSGGFMGLRRLIIVHDITWLKPKRKKNSTTSSSSIDNSDKVSGVDIEKNEPMNVPQYCTSIFPGNLIHGAAQNNHTKIRFSTDFRILPFRFHNQDLTKQHHFSSGKPYFEIF